MLPANAFGGRSSTYGPQLFMTDDSAAERNALKSVWPHATLLLCIFHVLQVLMALHVLFIIIIYAKTFFKALWRWLCDSKHKIILTDRPHLLGLLKKMLYAPTVSDLQCHFDAIKNDAVARKYMNFIEHMDTMYKRKLEWALSCRKDLHVRGNNTNNICEAGMLVMKDYILQRVKAFNMVQVLISHQVFEKL